VKQVSIKLGAVCLALLAVAVLAPSASASTIGHLTFANCGGGGVTVTLTTVTWFPVVSAGTGCISAGLGTTVTFTGGSGVITAGENGTINDLATNSGNAGFLTFPGVTFDLVDVGPGSANTVCANTLDPAAASCSAVAGSPFVLTPTSTGTTITFNVAGLTNDASGIQTPWSGIFSTQLSGVTPLAIQDTINSSGSFTTTYSFDGAATGVPEPISMSLIGAGLIGLACIKRRRLV
jgi:hypothetical protein